MLENAIWTEKCFKNNKFDSKIGKVLLNRVWTVLFQKKREVKNWVSVCKKIILNLKRVLVNCSIEFFLWAIGAFVKVKLGCLGGIRKIFDLCAFFLLTER